MNPPLTEMPVSSVGTDYLLCLSEEEVRLHAVLCRQFLADAPACGCEYLSLCGDCQLAG